MIKSLKARQSFCLICLFFIAGFAVAQDADVPVQTIEKTATALQQKLSGKQKYFEQNSAELYELIDTVLLPSFDVEYSAKQVLGRTHWTSSSEEQRDRFIKAFYSFLIKTYSKAILNFDQDNMTVLPEASYSKDKRKALVRTKILLDGGDSLLINYAMREQPDSWLIYDLRVDGVSYIQNYRSQFDAEIKANGIDAVIERLEAEAAEADAANKAAKSSAAG
ncbi:MAG: MlaC/ttg2D family ABC transporter substrate-binding protein [Gammaproteobacteria bacterium]